MKKAERQERHRRGNSIDNLPQGLRDSVCAMLVSKCPRFSQREIIQMVREKSEGKYEISRSALSRYWKAGLEEEMAEQKRIIMAGVEQRKQIEELLGAEGAPKKLTAEIMRQIDAGILANSNDASAESMVGLLIAKAKLMAAEAEQRKLDLAERRLEQQAKKLQLQIEKLNRDLQKEKDEAERRKSEATKALAAAEDVTDKQMYKRALGAIRKAVEG